MSEIGRPIRQQAAKRSLAAALIRRPEADIRQTETSARCEHGEHPRACHRWCGHSTWPKAVSSSRRASGAAVLVSYPPQDVAIGNSTVAAEYQGLRIAV